MKPRRQTGRRLRQRRWLSAPLRRSRPAWRRRRRPRWRRRPMPSGYVRRRWQPRRSGCRQSRPRLAPMSCRSSSGCPAASASTAGARRLPTCFTVGIGSCAGCTKGYCTSCSFCTRRDTVGGRLRRRLSCSVCRPNLPLSTSCVASGWLVALRYTLLQLSSAMCCCPAPRYLLPGFYCLLIPAFLCCAQVPEGRQGAGAIRLCGHGRSGRGATSRQLPAGHKHAAQGILLDFVTQPYIAACNSAWRVRCKAASCPEMLQVMCCTHHQSA